MVRLSYAYIFAATNMQVSKRMIQPHPTLGNLPNSKATVDDLDGRLARCKPPPESRDGDGTAGLNAGTAIRVMDHLKSARHCIISCGYMKIIKSWQLRYLPEALQT